MVVSSGKATPQAIEEAYGEFLIHLKKAREFQNPEDLESLFQEFKDLLAMKYLLQGNSVQTRLVWARSKHREDMKTNFSRLMEFNDARDEFLNSMARIVMGIDT